MRQDLVHALRLLVRQPGFSLTAVATLAMGVGANAAVFALAWHLMLKPLPWPHADRIVQIWGVSAKTGETNVLAPGNYFDFERESRRFDAIAAYSFFAYSLNLTGNNDPVEVRLRAVTGRYFDVFGTPPLLGRTIGAADLHGDRSVVVISEGLWKQQFGADPRIVGRIVQLDGRGHEVIGVMPATFEVTERATDAWLPWIFTPETRDRRLGFFLAAVGRMKSGVSLRQAQEDLAAIAGRAAIVYPESNRDVGVLTRPISEELAMNVRGGVWLLAGAAALVLLIACSNLASLQFARATARSRELAIRAALGGTRARVMRQLLTESVVLSLVAGYVGLFVGVWTTRLLALDAPPSIARAAVVTIDPIIVICTAVLSLVAALVFACGPAWRATRGDSLDVLKGRAIGDPRTRVIRSLLVTAEVTLATVVLVSAAVLVVSMVRVLRIDPGFDPAGIVAADVSLPSSYESAAERAAFFGGVIERLRGVNGVESACATNAVPLEARPGTMTYVPQETARMVVALPLAVSQGCFETLGLPLRRGRLFDAFEPTDVAVVSESFARRAFGDQDPLGKIMRIGLPDGPPVTIVGIVADARYVSLERLPFGQVYHFAGRSEFPVPSKVLVRATMAPEAVAVLLRQEIKAQDPSQPVSRVRTLEAVVGRSLAPRRFNVQLLATFALIALLLAAVGVYGLLAQIVSQRRAEIGVRMALGADARSVVRLVTGGVLRAVALGLVLGCILSWTGSRLLAGFAFGVSTTAPEIYAGTAIVLLTVALCAAWLPARRAARIDPVVALRVDA